MSLLSLLRSPTQDRALTDWGDWNPSRSSDSVDVNEVTAFNLSGVWACQTLIADAIATMPIDVFSQNGDEQVPRPNPQWITQPNPENLQVDYDTTRILSVLGWGDSFSLLVRAGGTSDQRDPIVERWNLDPWRVDVRKNGPTRAYFVDGQQVPTGNIQHIPGYKLPQALRGMSAIQNARQSLTMAASAERTGTNMFRNGLNPSGVMQMPQMPDDLEAGVVEQLRTQISSAYGGGANAGRPMVLTGGTTWNPMSINPVDAQWLETRRFQIDEICRWFRVPPHMVAQVDRTTSWGTGIEQQSLQFVRYTLNTWLVRLEQYDTLLLPRGISLKYNVNSLAKADLKTRYEAYKIGKDGGWLSSNDIRGKEDMPAIDNGDRYLEPLNYHEAGEEPPEPPEPPAPVVVPDPNVEDSTDD